MNNFLKKLIGPFNFTLLVVVAFISIYVYINSFGNIRYNDLLTTIDRKIVDYILKYRQPQATSDRIGLVAVDGESVLKIGRWPWPRNIITEALHILNDYYNVSVIGFDIVFSEPDNTFATVKKALSQLPPNELKAGAREEIYRSFDYDLELKNAIDQYNNVVSGYFFRNDLDESNLTKQNIADRLDYIDRSKIPTLIYRHNKPALNLVHSAKFPEINYFSKDLKNNFSAGFFSITPDPDDGVVRRLESVYRIDDVYYPALSVATFQKYLEINYPDEFHGLALEYDENGNLFRLNIGERQIPVDSEGTLRINYLGPPQTIKNFSFYDVLHKKYPKEELEGKIVLLGVTELGVYDIRSTPVSPEFPGLEVQGTILENLMTNSFLVQNDLTQIYSIMEIFFGCLLLYFFKRKISSLFGDLLSISLAVGIVVLNIYLLNSYSYVVSSAYPVSALFLVWIYEVLYSAFTEGRDKRFIKSAFGQYLSPRVIDQLIDDPATLKLGGATRDLTIVFTDLQGFSSISETLNVQELTSLLNSYLTRMVSIILANDGTVDKFEGDAIIAFWGAPVPNEQHHASACKAVVEMQMDMVKFRKEYASTKHPPFIMRVGINSGPVMVGNFGSEQRMDYTVIGDTANLAARLEGVNKIYRTEVIISESTYNVVADKFEARLLDAVRVVGKSQAVKIYQLATFKGQLSKLEASKFSLYDQGLNCYLKRDWPNAQKYWKQVLELDENDGPSKTMLMRAEEYAANPPAADWDGVYDLVSK